MIDPPRRAAPRGGFGRSAGARRRQQFRRLCRAARATEAGAGARRRARGVAAIGGAQLQPFRHGRRSTSNRAGQARLCHAGRCRTPRRPCRRPVASGRIIGTNPFAIGFPTRRAGAVRARHGDQRRCGARQDHRRRQDRATPFRWAGRSTRRGRADHRCAGGAGGLGAAAGRGQGLGPGDGHRHSVRRAERGGLRSVRSTTCTTTGSGRRHVGHFLVAFDIAKFMPLEGFLDRIEIFIARAEGRAEGPPASRRSSMPASWNTAAQRPTRRTASCCRTR